MAYMHGAVHTGKLLTINVPRHQVGECETAEAGLTEFQESRVIA